MADVVRTTLLLPRDLQERLKAMAARERRSMHAQMLYLLEQAVPKVRLEVAS